MNIIIAGAGKVGFNLARTLCIGHNVIVLDSNKDALERIQESLDILPHFGDIRDPKSYKDFEDLEIDLFIAVTNLDDVNIIASMVIDEVLSVKRKFLRLHKEYYDEVNLKERLNISEIIFPFKLSSKSIDKLIDYPKLNNIKDFKYTKLKLISLFSTVEMDLDELEMKDAIVVAIERDKRLLTQDLQKIEIQRGDLVYLFIAEESIKEVCDLFDKDRLNMIENCVIFGAGELGVDIAQTLVERKRVVKIVDRDIALCQQAQESLAGRVEVINSKYNKDENLFIEEGLDQADIFISTYKNDEYNIIKCLEAKEFGVKKVLAINNESEYYNLMHRLGIVAVRGAKMSAYNTMIERINSSNIIVEKHFCGGKGVIYLRRIFANSKLIGVRIFKPKIEGVKLFFIREDMIENSDEIILQEGDVIVALCGVEVASKTKLWIYEL